jgi:dTDP-4-dehydrorhamnose 3,5-epimerase-like enzyme
MAFVFEEQKIPSVFVITPQVFGDSRGYFTRRSRHLTLQHTEFQLLSFRTMRAVAARVFCVVCISRWSILREYW